MNKSQAKARTTSLELVVSNIFAARKISASDRQFLRTALFLPRLLSTTEQNQIKQVYEELMAGRISIVK
ncbi:MULTISPECIES: hypothetical protein [Okeania]|uniref:Uncharacterized protein n=1 Tax=Okeania hirsuta TaxID=1458930 RepID=A0A3N6PGX6_9CYAN|nr:MULTISPECIES: hypothetical protein [Okeania]NES89684.1 hypothetical protein [Okeania sp. SIO2B9]NET79077.1 hypothetical protein [Okeania sp. SIO1F9]RQH21863.1 hypothetical protein D4Z78_08680 [Okeania hirsuta]RQH48719.1 hypothetical protein D5R40_07695 [Okeania hirsuta]